MVRMAIIAATLMVGISGTFAQDPQRGGTPQQQQACTKDVSRHCRSVMNESDAIIAGCLREHRSKLSKSCLRALAERQ
jgi:Cysteine rich repeat